MLGHYSRELGLFPLETAVHKMTGATADLYGLGDRGRLQPGKKADLMFVQHMLASLKPNGRMATIMPHPVNGEGREPRAKRQKPLSS